MILTIIIAINRFVIIVNFLYSFLKALTEIFQFRRALHHNIKSMKSIKPVESVKVNNNNNSNVVVKPVEIVENGPIISCLNCNVIIPMPVF